MRSKISSNIFQLYKPRLKRTLGILDLCAVGYGDLGSSIYYALGITALYSLGATPISLLLAGFVFVCTALTYGEMTSSIHDSGGSASFARHAFNDMTSFVAGWGLLLDYIVTIAISSFTVGPYLSVFFPKLSSSENQVLFTTFLIFILFVINFFGVRQSSRLSMVLVGFTLITKIVIVGMGFALLLNLPYVLEHIKIGVANVDWSPSWAQFWKGTAMAMVAYTGIESIAQMGSEVNKPSKNVPRAIMIVMVVVIMMYLGISLTALSALSPQDLASKYMTNPILGVVEAFPIGGKFLVPLVGLVAAAILIGAANAGLIGASRLSFNMGEYYQLPRIFYRVHERFRTPYVALLFFGFLATVIVWASRGRMSFLADLYNFGAMLAFFFDHLSLIVLRIRNPGMERPFKVPFNIKISKFEIPIPAVIGCLTTLSVWILVIITKPYGRNLGLAWLTVGIIMFFIYRRKRRLTTTGSIEIEQIKIPKFKPFEIHNVLVFDETGERTEAVQVACELAKSHGASVTYLYIIPISPAMPLDVNLPQKILAAEKALRNVEAIAREYRIDVKMQSIKSRNMVDTILSLLTSEKIDLLVMETSDINKKRKFFEGEVAEILRKASCKVWLCSDTA